jgi:Ferritin-like domain
MSEQNLAAPELAAIDIQGVTRQSFMLRGALAAGAVYGLGAVTPYVSEALAQGAGGDVDILNFALTLEYLESTFYKEALKKVNGLSGQAKSIATTIADDEVQHVDALTKAVKDLGGKPAAVPKVDFGNAFSSQKSFLKLAQTFEDTGVSAYNGAAPQIKSKQVLASAGSIVQVEARHASAIRTLNGNPITAGAFDKPLTMAEVLKAVKPFVKS